MTQTRNRVIGGLAVLLGVVMIGGGAVKLAGVSSQVAAFTAWVSSANNPSEVKCVNNPAVARLRGMPTAAPQVLRPDRLLESVSGRWDLSL
jgi:hypothetical protein